MSLSDELEALAAKATPETWLQEEDPVDSRDYKTLATLKGQGHTWVMRAEHNWRDADRSERRISWKEAESNVELVCTLRNNLPQIIEALRLAEKSSTAVPPDGAVSALADRVETSAANPDVASLENRDEK